MIGRYRSPGHRKKSTKKRIDVGDVADIEKELEWLYYNTEWAADFDSETQARTMLSIWDAENIVGQRWTVTTKRRRKKDGIGKLERIHVATVDSFPSHHSLETVVLSMEYGGGDYNLTSTRGPTQTHRITIEGGPEDPAAAVISVSGPEPNINEQKDRFEAEMLDIAFGYLRENPEAMREVALKLLAKKIGVKIPVPDPNAPVPYEDLPVDLQDWLDDHPEDKDAYMRRLLGIEEPEVQPTLEKRMVKTMEEEIVANAASGIRNRSSALETVAMDLVRGTDLMKLIEQLPVLLPGKFGGPQDGVITGDQV